MISVLYSEGRHAPLVICDSCGQPILDAGLGMVAFDGIGEEGKRLNIAFLHKGNCDKAYKGGRSRPGGWNELSHFLFRICHNTGLTADKFAAAGEDVEDLNSFS